uniref:Glycoprotein n=1 Tax=Caenorhabditis tropicalis TaxID=1561998 RepID=A0A1I7U0I0_9PELO
MNCVTDVIVLNRIRVMGNTFKHLFLLVIISILVPLICNGYQPSKQCIQCVAGNFLSYKWLMVDKHIKQEIEWKDEWTDTDCLEERVHFKDHCYGPCITIHILPYLDSGFTTDGILMDCSDNLIYRSPDVNLSSRLIDQTFTARRDNHRIVYEFAQFSTTNTQAVAEHFLKVIPHHRKINMTTATKIIYGLFGIFLICSFITACYLLRAMCCKMSYNRKYERPNRNDIEMEVHHSNLEYPRLVRRYSLGVSRSSEISQPPLRSEHPLRNPETLDDCHDDDLSTYVPRDFKSLKRKRESVLTYISDDTDNTFYNLGRREHLCDDISGQPTTSRSYN